MAHLLSSINTKDLKVWAVVLNDAVVNTFVGHPDQYIAPDELNIKLVEFSHDRGFASIGDTWTGERFVKL